MKIKCKSIFHTVVLCNIMMTLETFATQVSCYNILLHRQVLFSARRAVVKLSASSQFAILCYGDNLWLFTRMQTSSLCK